MTPYSLDVAQQNVPDQFEDDRAIWREGWTRCFLCGHQIALLGDRFSVSQRGAMELYGHRACILAQHGALLSLEYQSAVQDIMLGRRVWEAVRLANLRMGSA